jgi:hypothetical protein
MKRRDFIWTSVGTGAVFGVSGAGGAELKPTRVIDTHTHFYDPSRPGGVPWPPKDSKLLYRTVLPDDWAAVAGPQGVRETVVVEASPLVEDNQWVLDLAAKDARLIPMRGLAAEPFNQLDEEGDDVRIVMCMHRFHKRCIDPWLRTHPTCPVCKNRAIE